MNGWLVIDKPENISSAGAINVIKKIFRKLGYKKIKIGHAGTLDPLASGLLIVGIGEATKLINYIMDAPKTYKFTITWGENRDTLDREGKVTATSKTIPQLSEVEEVLTNFKGTLKQIPPEYSAIKINGERAYDLARSGVEVRLESREVILHHLKLINYRKDSITLEANCGKGFYIRSLARDIALSLGVCGYVSYLRRIESKKFNISDAIPLDKLQNILHNSEHDSCRQFLQMNTKPITSVLDDILVQNLDEAKANKLKTGIPVYIDAKLEENMEIAAIHNSKLVAICVFQNGQLKPKRVFNI